MAGSNEVRLRKSDPGVMIDAVLEYVGSDPHIDRPKLYALISEPDNYGEAQYGHTRPFKSGRFKIKIPADTKRGSLQIVGEGRRFMGTTDFTVEEGEVRFAGPLQLQSGCRLTVNITGGDGPIEGPISGKYILSGYHPGLNAVNNRYHKAVPSKLGATQVYGHLAPRSNGWIVLNCDGYATLRKNVDEALLQWGSEVELNLIMKPEIPMTIRVENAFDRPFDGAAVFINNSKNQGRGAKYSWSGSEAAFAIERLGPGTYHTLVTGPGLLPSVDVLTLDNMARLDFTWDHRVNPGLGIQGRVLGSDGEPLAGAELWIRPVSNGLAKLKPKSEWGKQGAGFNPDCEWTGIADSEGRFFLSGFQRAKSFEVLIKGPPPAFSIPSGLNKPKMRRYIRKNSVWTNLSGVAPRLEPIEVVMGASPSGLHGHVLDDQGESLSVYRVRAYADCDGPRLESFVASGEFDAKQLGPFVKISGVHLEGGFAFPEIQGGSWALLVTKDGYADQVVRSVAPGLDRRTVVLARLGSISGVVLDAGGEVLPEASVVLISEEGHSTSHSIGKEFVLEDLAPGAYTVVAHHLSEGMSAPQFLEVLPGKETANIRLGLLSAGSVVGMIDPKFRDMGLKVHLRSKAQSGGRPVLELPEHEAVPDESGAFALEGVSPGTYWVTDTFKDPENPDASRGTGHRQEIEVEPGQATQLSYEPIGLSLVEGTIQMDGQASWVCLEDRSTNRLCSAPIEPNGTYRAWVPSTGSYNVHVCVRSEEGSEDTYQLLSANWSVPGQSPQAVATKADWVVPTGSVKIEWLDEKGELIRWVQEPAPAKAVWYPVGSDSRYGSSGVVAQGSEISNLLPGTSYRIHLQGNSLFGDLLEARHVLIQVPEDGSIGTVQVRCVNYATD